MDAQEPRQRVAEALAQVVRDFGRAAATSPSRLHGQLNDVLGEHAMTARAEAAAVVAAAAAGVAGALFERSVGPGPSDRELIGRLADVGLDTGRGAFAVEAWATALGVPGLAPGTVPVAATVIPPDTTVLPPGPPHVIAVDPTELPQPGGGQSYTLGSAVVSSRRTRPRRQAAIAGAAALAVAVAGGTAWAVLGNGSKTDASRLTATASSSTSPSSTSPSSSPTAAAKLPVRPSPAVASGKPVPAPSTAPAPRPAVTRSSPSRPRASSPPPRRSIAPSPKPTPPPSPKPSPRPSPPVARNFSTSYTPYALYAGHCYYQYVAGATGWCQATIKIQNSSGSWTSVVITGVTNDGLASVRGGSAIYITPKRNGQFVWYVYYKLYNSSTRLYSNEAVASVTVLHNPNYL